METYYTYKKYGIRYRTLGGTTTVENSGTVIYEMEGAGEIVGDKYARKFIDNIYDQVG